MPSKSVTKRKSVNLALQGGGAHGAFTWGVLDRIFEDGRLEIEAISGTSAGAMNAVVAADGMMADGHEGARHALRDFWKAMSVAALSSPYKRSWYDIEFVGRMLDEGSLDPKRYKKLRIHIIKAEKGFEDLNASSKMNAEWEFLRYLFEVGRQVADDWLQTHFDAIGQRSTLDLYGLVH